MEQDEVLTVRIPQGVEEGVALRIPGKGMPSPEAGGISGDLFVVARSRSDPRFERAGPDLWRQETVSLTDAVLGAALQVPTLNGSVKLSMPAGTQPGAVFRLKGKGLSEFGSERRGEMYVRVEVQIPQQLSRDERQLYELLRSIQRS
jgi:molecular chaperone DnaJ